jgi:cell division septum initiation protein DivIVA
VEEEKWNPQKTVNSIKGGVSRFLDNLPANRSLQEENARLKAELDHAQEEVQRLNEEIGALRRQSNTEVSRMLEAFLVQMEALQLDADQAIGSWHEKAQQLKDEALRWQEPAAGGED